MALQAIQCLGGTGLYQHYPTGLLLARCELYEIGAGTTPSALWLIGRELFEETG